MTVVRINTIEVPAGNRDEIIARFRSRLDDLSGVDGFAGFELLEPTGEAETRWFVYTRWESEEAFRAWREGDSFQRDHADRGPARPVATGAGLLEFDVVASADPSG